MRKYFFIIAFILLFCIQAYAEETYVTYPYNPVLENDIYNIKCDIYIESDYEDSTKKIITALYDSKGKLLDIGTTDYIKGEVNYKLEIPALEDVCSFKTFMWSEHMMPVAKVRHVALRSVKVEKELINDGSVNMIFDKDETIAEVRVLRPLYINTWNSEIWVYEKSGEEKKEVVGNCMNVKENGSYIIHTTYKNGSENLSSIEVNEIARPQINLSASYNDNSAVISVDILDSNANAPIKKLVWLYDLEWWSSNANVEAQKHAETGNDISTETYQFVAEQNGKYTVIAIDEWGNSVLKDIEIQGLER